MSVTVISHVAEVESALEEAMIRAAIMAGGVIEGHAKELCPVDTGLLRNSITYAVGGKPPNVSSYSGDKGGSGGYAGDAPSDAEGEVTVYVGTNVQYAPYVELGHNQEPGRFVPALGKRLKASHVAAKPFLRPAAENNREEIKQAIKEGLGG